jgi:hypothetical protein
MYVPSRNALRPTSASPSHKTTSSTSSSSELLNQMCDDFFCPKSFRINETLNILKQASICRTCKISVVKEAAQNNLLSVLLSKSTSSRRNIIRESNEFDSDCRLPFGTVQARTDDSKTLICLPWQRSSKTQPGRIHFALISLLYRCFFGKESVATIWKFNIIGAFFLYAMF